MRTPYRGGTPARGHRQRHRLRRHQGPLLPIRRRSDRKPRPRPNATGGLWRALGPNDFSDLSYSTGPVYVNTNALGRPGSASGEWGLTFDGTASSLVRTG